MQRLNFGQIVGLRVQGGQPLFDPPPRIVRDRKLLSEPSGRPTSSRDDFLLKQQVVELFGVFDQLGDGVIDEIEVKHGFLNHLGEVNDASHGEDLRRREIPQVVYKHPQQGPESLSFAKHQ
jgi:hypothetical protein